MSTPYGPDGRMVPGVRVIVRDNGRFTDENQYAVLREGERLFLRVLQRDDWTDDPIVMDVRHVYGVGRLCR